METRCFGRTEHLSTVAIFGGAAFWEISQAEADRVMEAVLEAGVNHIDVAPQYGMAEERLGPWMPRVRDQVFLGCKTMERTYAGALSEMKRSLERLKVDHFDLYQMHAVNTLEDLDAVTSRGGALEAALEAKKNGLTRYVGITGHGYGVPALFSEALDRFDFDSVLFPLNFIQFADPVFRKNTEMLLKKCRARNVGVMAIKSICRGPWGEQPKGYTTWYQPFDTPEKIQQAVNFVLSQDVTGICMAGETRLLPSILHACQKFTPLSPQAQEELIATAEKYSPLFVP